MKLNLFALIQIAFFLLSCTSTSNKGELKKVQADTVITAEIKSEVMEIESKTQVVENKKMIPEGRCDINTILRTKRRIQSLTDDDVYSFLFTFSEDCKNNVEFGEFSNEILFQVLLKYADIISNHLKRDSIYQDIILSELANPVMEMQSVDEIIERINSLEVSEQSKQNVITSLKATLGYSETPPDSSSSTTRM